MTAVVRNACHDDSTGGELERLQNVETNNGDGQSYSRGEQAKSATNGLANNAR